MVQAVILFIFLFLLFYMSCTYIDIKFKLLKEANEEKKKLIRSLKDYLAYLKEDNLTLTNRLTSLSEIINYRSMKFNTMRLENLQLKKDIILNKQHIKNLQMKLNKLKTN